MTEDQKYEYDILKLANESGKFTLAIGATFNTLPEHEAFERLQVRRWISLIDLSPIAEQPGRVFRIFLASDVALRWYRGQS